MKIGDGARQRNTVFFKREKEKREREECSNTSPKTPKSAVLMFLEMLRCQVAIKTSIRIVWVHP